MFNKFCWVIFLNIFEWLCRFHPLALQIFPRNVSTMLRFSRRRSFFGETVTRFFLFFMITNTLHSAETSEQQPLSPRAAIFEYTIMTSKLTSSERREAYRVLYGINGDSVYARHFSGPHRVRSEILTLKGNFERDAAAHQEEIAACEKILILFPH